MEPLIRALSDEDDVVRGSAAFALGEIGDARAAEALKGALDDRDEYVREHAAISLEQLDETGALE
jgi:HEAT repeat protein